MIRAVITLSRILLAVLALVLLAFAALPAGSAQAVEEPVTFTYASESMLLTYRAVVGNIEYKIMVYASDRQGEAGPVSDAGVMVEGRNLRTGERTSYSTFAAVSLPPGAFKADTQKGRLHTTLNACNSLGECRVVSIGLRGSAAKAPIVNSMSATLYPAGCREHWQFHTMQSQASFSGRLAVEGIGVNFANFRPGMSRLETATSTVTYTPTSPGGCDTVMRARD
jgi:hypothetical protein